MSSVLYDVPGPKAIARNRILAVITALLVLAGIAWVIWRFAVTGQFTAKKWELFTYSSIWALFGEATLNTLAAFAAAAVGALVLGFLLALGRLSDHAWVRVPVGWIIEILRAIPVLIFMMLLYYGLPVVGIKMQPYWAVVIALVAYNGSVLAEVIRAGVESLPRGQSEAGYAIGLRKSGVMAFVLLPQAIRAMMPVIVAQLVVTLKDTALGFIITYHELLYLVKLLGSNAVYGSPLIPAAIVGGSIYVALCLALSYIARLLEKRLKRQDSALTPVDPMHHPVGDVTDTQLIGLQNVPDGGSGAEGGGFGRRPR
ncbi:amino acid ABC transporter permease [Microbacterium lacticum]|uniref:Amino acid ABC transporter membrane protein 2 (PAAT family) n=1 Tax=Microbacterium lacticum TaxID=33885 RepID=A0A4Y3UNF6_9MICO|nr:amino acid ABC transporter permease [Microbacterium lacticum]TQM99994.1 amino acid ABC transporter membrane protein 2 (PAAT family) [Microbacterium lacticum]GEB94998.1 amino acid ABC transporter permease [Microbacterium lacticum]GGN20653.1 amino acid ABC transporter permease [Microbacterium lacticum]